MDISVLLKDKTGLRLKNDFSDWDERIDKREVVKISATFIDLTTLPDLSEFVNLTELYCGMNELTQIPSLTKCKKLRKLYCFNNKITQLPDLSQCKLLTHLVCHENLITHLPDLSQFRQFILLKCSDNLLTSLPPLHLCKQLSLVRAEGNFLPISEINKIKKLEDGKREIKVNYQLHYHYLYAIIQRKWKQSHYAPFLNNIYNPDIRADILRWI